MSLRARIALVAAGAVAFAVLAVSLAAYFTTESTLRGQIDRDLAAQAERSVRELRMSPRAWRGINRIGPVGPFGGPQVIRQVIDANGQAMNVGTSTKIPVDENAIAVARGANARYSEFSVGPIQIRALTVPLSDGMALQVARPLEEMNASLDRLRQRLFLVSLAGILISGFAGLAVASRGVRPVTRLTESLEIVSRTQDLSHRVEVAGTDEPARLAATFNNMLASLEQARNAQEQLVADASHELRTPLSALRTNAELLASGVQIEPDERRRIAVDVASQIDGFGRLVEDLVELTRGERAAPHPQPLRLDELVGDAVARARSLHPGVTFTFQAQPSPVVADQTLIERAVNNLIENAVRHGAPPIEVQVSGPTVRVRDHGPGIPADDHEKVFARFWRSADARSREGSGLGLSIVMQVARAHGGEVTVADAPGGGALFTLQLSHEIRQAPQPTR